MGLILVDTLDSIFVRSAFSKILKTKIFTYMSYALSGVALTVAAAETYSTIYNIDVPEYIGPVLAVTVIGTAFGYGYVTRNKTVITTRHHHHHIQPSSSVENKPKEEKESS
jgi:nickel/cobalt transporter (NiCoT) family protein